MSASKAQRAKTAERRAKAIALRLAGLDWDTIAERLEYSGRAAACKDVSRALAERQARVHESVDELRAIELMRLDRLQVGIWQRASRGDAKAIETVLKIMVQRLKYVPGLEAPTGAEVHTLDYLDAAIAAAEAELAAGDAAGEAAPPA